MSTLEDVGGGALLTAVVLGSGASWFGVVRGGLRRHGLEHRVRERTSRAQAAVTEASLEDAWFSPEEVHSTIAAIVALATGVWRDGQAPTSRREDRQLIERWARSVIAALGDGVQLATEPAYDVVRVVDRPGEDEDRIVLRVRLRFRRAHHEFGEPRTVRADFRWVLARANHAWRLMSVDSDPLADLVLDRPSIVAAWADEARLREQSLLELADADAAGPGVDLGSLISTDLPVRRQMLELAQLDGRFDPDLVESRLAHIVETWEEACTGSPKPLAAVTSPEAFEALLSPPSDDEPRRLVVRDVVIDSWEPTKLVLSGASPEIQVTVTVTAVRYVVAGLSGTHLGGSVEARHQIRLDWILALTDATPAVWALAASTNPAERVPGGGRQSEA